MPSRVPWRILSATALTVALVAGGPWGAASAAEGGGRSIDGSAVAEASVPGTHLARSSLDLVFAPGGHWVHATNFAVAHSTCDGCRSVAASIQVVVVRDKGASVDAGNAALALNEGCTSCESLADAHQVVLLVGPRTTLAGWVHQAVQQLRAELADLVASDLPLARAAAEDRRTGRPAAGHRRVRAHRARQLAGVGAGRPGRAARRAGPLTCTRHRGHSTGGTSA